MLAWLALALTLAPSAATSQALRERSREAGPFDLTAESIEYEKGRDLYVARGEVRISQPERTLTADWVAFSNQSGRGLATGNVVVTEAGDTLYADVLVFEVDELRGVVFEGRLDARDSEFLMTGREVRRIGEDEYVFEEGTFTTCRCPDDGVEPWLIRAEHAELDVGGYGTARNTTFEVLGVPVLWLPWLLVPLRTDRHTGVLFPEVAIASRTGTSIGLPLFWAARQDLNLTLTPRYLTKRGFMPRLDLEYLLGETVEGRFMGTGLHDKDVDRDDPDTPYSPNRWAAEWIHEQELPLGWRGVLDGRAFSDNSVPFDFDDLSNYRADRYVESTAFFDRRFGPGARDAAFLGAVYADDTQNPNNEDRDKFLLQRAPELGLSFAPRQLPGRAQVLRAALDVDYANFVVRERAGSVYPEYAPVNRQFLDTGVDGIPNPRELDADGNPFFDADKDFGELNGIFDEGEPLADHGQRILVNPRLTLPLRLFDTVEVLAEAGWQGTGYDTRLRSSTLRSLFTGQIDLRTRLRRELRLPLRGGTGIHVMEPSLAWTGVTNTSQGNNPLLVPGTANPQRRLRQLDLNNVTRDSADRIDSENLFTLGVGNRLYAPGREGGPPRLLGDVAVSAQYDASGNDFEGLYADGRLVLPNDFGSRFSLGYDLGDGRFSEALLRLGWSSEAGHDLGIQYRYLRDVPPFFESFLTDRDRFDDAKSNFDRVNQFGLQGRLALTRRWAVTYAGIYSIKDAIFLANQAGLEYVSRCRCWALRIEVEDQRQRGFDVGFRYTLIGLGQDTVRPFSERLGFGVRR